MFPIKDDQPRFTTPFVNGFLIGFNILVYLFQATLDPRSYELFARQFGVVPSHIQAFLSGSPKYPLIAIVIPFFTSMFLHGGWMHVLGNMWFLFIFGDNIEDYLGHFTYLVFYIVCGVFAMLAQVIIYPYSNIPCVGASGAIAGVLGAYFLLYPRARVLTWFFVFVTYIPAWIVLGYWFILNFFEGTAMLSVAHTGRDVGGVAVWAHVGGFITGLLLVKLLPERQQRSPYGYRA